jgi:putative glutamine amidotransferase
MKIALTYTGSEAKHQNYLNWLGIDSDIYVETLNANAADAADKINDCDALVLSGGIDVQPSLYHNAQVDYPFRPLNFDLKRDALEMHVLKAALDKRKPVLAICRGLQLLNVFFGGGLIQDLGALNQVHKAIIDPSGQQFDKAHAVHLTENTLLSALHPSRRGIVNSAHHQGIAAVAPSLIANCVADDGTVEGLEWKEPKGKSYLLAVQWHPERMYQFGLEDSPLSSGIRNTFLHAIRQSLALS